MDINYRKKCIAKKIHVPFAILWTIDTMHGFLHETLIDHKGMDVSPSNLKMAVTAMYKTLPTLVLSKKWTLTTSSVEVGGCGHCISALANTKNSWPH